MAITVEDTAVPLCPTIPVNQKKRSKGLSLTGLSFESRKCSEERILLMRMSKRNYQR